MTVRPHKGMFTEAKQFVLGGDLFPPIGRNTKLDSVRFFAFVWGGASKCGVTQVGRSDFILLLMWLGPVFLQIFHFIFVNFLDHFRQASSSFVLTN